MNRSIATTPIDTAEYLTVGRLLEKLQFEDVDQRIAINVELLEDALPPTLVTLLLMRPEGDIRDLFVWVPKH